MKIERRGRIAENDTPVLQYTQEFKEYTGETFTWEWDKTKFPNGPLSVEIKSPEWNAFDKLERQLANLTAKYEVKGNQRKPRITKADKLEIEQLENDMNEIFYSFFPEDRPKQRKPRKTK
jgi:hypothetical protein